MKAKVISPFIDKHTKKLYKKGYYEGDAKRIDELARGGFVEKPKKKTKKESE